MFSILIISFCCLLILLVFMAYYISKRKFTYWDKKRVPYEKPVPIFGNFKEYILRKKYEGIVAQEICQKFPNEPYIGAFFGTDPMLLVQDPELIKLIIAKDFYYFNGRAISNYAQKEPFTQSLFFTSGDHWKVLRQNLSPLFSTAKLKNMFHIIEESTIALNSLLERKNTMSKNYKSNPFLIYGDKIFEVSLIRDLKVIARLLWPAIFYATGLKTIPPKIHKFFGKLLTNAFETRQYTPSKRHDFVDLLLNFKKNKFISGDSIHNYKTTEGKKVQLEPTDDLLLGQCIGIFGAGYDTSATALTLTLYELPKNQETQQRAIAEVDAYIAKNQGKLDFECITKLLYLDACINEDLRLYPVLGVISREVMESYTFPDGLRLEKGLRVHIPAYHIHRLPEHFPEPEKYRPERFLADEKDTIKPYTILSFGEGPRICIGLRFAKMQMLPGLLTILRKYRLELAEGTPLSLELEPAVMVTKPRHCIRLKFISRSNE